MERVQSFKGYGKVDEKEDVEFKRKVRRRIIIIVVSTILLVSVVIGAVVIWKTQTTKNNNNSTNYQLNSSAALTSVCSQTQYPDSCFTSLSRYEVSHNSSSTINPIQIFKFSLLVAMDELISFVNHTQQVIASQITDPMEQQAFTICYEVIDDAIDMLNDSIALLDSDEGSSSSKVLPTGKIDNLRTMLSAVIADQETCLDTLAEVNSTHLGDIKIAMQNSTQFASNTLAIVTKVVGLLSKFRFGLHKRRRLLGWKDEGGSDLPGWVSVGDRRRLLQASNPNPNTIVALDGSGNYKSIGDAVEAIPDKSKSRFVIYVKAGIYKEKVILNKNKWNVMMYGDGKTQTIVTGSLNFVDGTPTSATATFVVQGKGFMARDMGFQNTAGPAKHQAVAFRSTSDLSAIYRCSFDAYQDTLYTHANRQFFRDCDITGTVDFIFGYAAVVIQSCNIVPREPMSGQFDTITAQGKADPNMVSGISIQSCTVTSNANFTAPTYLGRPWKAYSTTVFMQSSIGAFLNPKGWAEWTTGVTPPDTIFYAEYNNVGPGSDTSGRVPWSGYNPALTTDAATKFTVNSFIQGSSWLPNFGVPFNPSL